jgi:hypothetical protein
MDGGTTTTPVNYVDYFGINRIRVIFTCHTFARSSATTIDYFGTRMLATATFAQFAHPSAITDGLSTILLLHIIIVLHV